jgi:hypothetical protein
MGSEKKMSLGKKLGKTVSRTGIYALGYVFIIVFIETLHSNNVLTDAMINPFTINQLITFLMWFGFLLYFILFWVLDN